MNCPKQFFLIWNPKGATLYQHNTEEGARAEAKRLAHENQGFEFIILSSLTTYTASPSLIIQEHNTAPF